MLKKKFPSILLRDSAGLQQERFPVSVAPDRFIDFWSSVWEKLIIRLALIGNGPSIDSRDGNLFRRRFRVPWQIYCELVIMCKEKKLYGKRSHLQFNACGAYICPIEIKLLSVLQMLGRNWCSDDVAKETGMGESTVRELFHSFIKNFVAELYDALLSSHLHKSS